MQSLNAGCFSTCTPVLQLLHQLLTAVGGAFPDLSQLFTHFMHGLQNSAVLQQPFDPFPFILLNLMLSCLAALQAPVIMMSQNRQAAKDRLAASLDYRTNLRAEIDILRLHHKLDNGVTERLDTLEAKIDGLAKALARS